MWRMFLRTLTISFEVIDKSTTENLFANGTFIQDQIEVINSIDGGAVEFDFISEYDLNLIQINSIGWQSETKDILA